MKPQQQLRFRVAYQPQAGDRITTVCGMDSSLLEVVTVLVVEDAMVKVDCDFPFAPLWPRPYHSYMPLFYWTSQARRAHRVEEDTCPK